MIAIVEDGKVTYRGNLPDKFQNSNMNVTALRLSEGNWESLNAKGIFELIEITPDYDSTTHKIDGFTDDIQEDKVIQTYIVRAKTQEELDADAELAATEYIRKRQSEYPKPDELIVALWEHVIEGQPEAAAILQAKREAIKIKYPKPIE
jgi:hypothetical protein